MRRLSFGLLGLLLLPSGKALAQTGLPIDPPLAVSGVTYDPAIPTPEVVLGHRIGTRHTRPDEIVQYVRALDAVSDRIAVEEYARTYEGRPLVVAYVTSPANHARREALRQANLRLSDAPGAVSDADLAGMPAVAWMGYSVHGNEASGSEAALLTLYHLAAGRGPEVDAVLQNAVLLFDPCLNPDGRARFADWANRHRGGVAVADPQDLEHAEAWPGGRTNHYWFDLNRDWLPLVHAESAGRLRLYHAWRPQLLTDYHEMGGEATFFFQPGVPSRVNPNTPAVNQALTGRVAEYHAAILDSLGSLYYTKEGYDDFYYGKGSTYPDANGTVGILFEQASSRSLVVDTENNGRLTYGFTVRNQLAASLSTLRALVALRTDLLRMQRDHYRTSSEAARAAGVGAYVFGGEPGRARMLVDLLGAHRIRAHALRRDVTVDGRRFRAGEAFVVPADQPQARLIRGVFERPQRFTDSLFYDVSAWTLPLAYGLDLAETSESGLAGDVVAPGALHAVAPGRVVGGRARVAYALPWGAFTAARGLYRLQQAGLRVRLARTPFGVTAGGTRTTLGRGTLVVPVAAQSVPADTVHALVARLAAEDGLTAYAVGTGLALDGPDLGSGGSAVIPTPRVALVVGDGVNAGPAGEAWHLLSERMRLPVALLDARRIGTADLSRYNTLLLTGGAYPSLPADELKRWVQRGGRLIASTNAAAWAVRNELVRLDSRSGGAADSALRALPYERLRDARGAGGIAGAIFEARVDPTHPLGYGLPDRLAFFRDDDTFYRPSSTPGATVAAYTNAPVLAGYVPAGGRRLASGAAAVVAQRVGQGSVVVIPDDPVFRGFWLGTAQLYLNAVFFGSSF